jgi:hypothetical protein
MKFLIWAGLLLAFSVLRVLISRFVHIGTIPTVIYWGAFFALSYWLGRRYDARKSGQSNDTHTEGQ